MKYQMCIMKIVYRIIEKMFSWPNDKTLSKKGLVYHATQPQTPNLIPEKSLSVGERGTHVQHSDSNAATCGVIRRLVPDFHVTHAH